MHLAQSAARCATSLLLSFLFCSSLAFLGDGDSFQSEAPNDSGCHALLLGPHTFSYQIGDFVRGRLLVFYSAGVKRFSRPCSHSYGILNISFVKHPDLLSASFFAVCGGCHEAMWFFCSLSAPQFSDHLIFLVACSEVRAPSWAQVPKQSPCRVRPTRIGFLRHVLSAPPASITIVCAYDFLPQVT